MIIGVDTERVARNAGKEMAREEAPDEMLRAFRAFVSSLKKDGHEVFYIDDPINYPACDLVFTNGIPKKAHPSYNFQKKLFYSQASRGAPILTIDWGFIKRPISEKYKNYSSNQITEPYWSLGFNGLNGRAQFVKENMPSDRWDKLNIELKPWKKEGARVLVCGQSSGDASVQQVEELYGIPFEHWILRVALALNQLSKRPILFRPHPKMSFPEGFFDGAPIEISNNLHKDIVSDFNNCSLVCALNSNALVDAAINGVPVMALDEGSLVWEYCNKSLESIDNPSTFDRENWKNNLAYSQWTTKEIENGEALDHLKSVYGQGKLAFTPFGVPFNKEYENWELFGRVLAAFGLDQTPSG